LHLTEKPYSSQI